MDGGEVHPWRQALHPFLWLFSLSPPFHSSHFVTRIQEYGLGDMVSAPRGLIVEGRHCVISLSRGSGRGSEASVRRELA